METLQALRRKIKGADDLHSVVRTMKSLAAVSIRQYEEAVRSLDDYYRAVELGLRATLRNRPVAGRAPAPGETVALLFGSEQGMVGQFNDAVVDFAGRALDEGAEAGKTLYWVVGARLMGTAEGRFGRFDEFFALPASARAVAETVQDVVLRYERHRQQRGETRLTLFHNAPTSGASYVQNTVNLLPPDEQWLREVGGQGWPGPGLPLYTLPWGSLFSSLIGEYLFVSLFRACALSMAAENAARLAAMQRAEKNIEEMQDDLTARYHSLRQSMITEELFDVISGFEALTTEKEGE
jgi:F-type H+-transporting ATPase subunit gamma